MGVIQKMRDKAGLMVVLIGAAMALFLLGDLLQNAVFFTGEDLTTVGSVGDREITTEEYDRYVGSQNATNDKQREQLHQQAWNDYVNRNVFQHVFATVPLSFSDEERNYHLYEEVHPQVYQFAMNFDRQLGGAFGIQYGVGGEAIRNMVSTYSQQNPQFGPYWDQFADYQLKDAIMKDKYTTLLKNGFFTPKAIATQTDKNATTTYEIQYLMKSSAAVNDSSITVTEEEIKEYYQSNLAEFKSQPSRDIKYVEFQVTPSDEDAEEVKKGLEQFAKEMSTMDNDRKQTYAANLDRNQDRTFYTQEELAGQGLAQLFEQPDTVFGPVRQGQKWTIYSGINKTMVPDSVKASHILIPFQGSRSADAQSMSKTDARKVIDSLKTALAANPADFADAATTYSADQGSAAKGGDLGWFTQGRMVPEFNDACFLAEKKGELAVVESVFGFHLIRIEDLGKKQERLRYAKVVREIKPSKKTIGAFRLQASRFQRGLTNTAEFDEAVLADPSLFITNAKGLNPMSFEIIGLNSPRELIKWAFQSEKGAVSRPYQFGTSFVVATVTGASDGEYQSLASATEVIETKLREKKAAEKISKEIKTAMASNNNLPALAKTLNLEIKNDNRLNVGKSNIGGRYAANVIGRLPYLEEGKLTGPFIEGSNVFVVKVIRKDEQTGEPVLDDDYRNAESVATRHINNNLIEAYSELLGVEDRRSTVYTLN